VERILRPKRKHAELEGVVTSLDTVKSRFVIAGVYVDYSGVSGGYTPVEGHIVEVVGSFDGIGVAADIVKPAD
jgi:hypothetical protein